MNTQLLNIIDQNVEEGLLVGNIVEATVGKELKGVEHVDGVVEFRSMDGWYSGLDSC